jgi:hypothetical protein
MGPPRLHHECTESAPRLPHKCTASALRVHHDGAMSAPRVHRESTTSPPRLHHECTRSLMPQPLKEFFPKSLRGRGGRVWQRYLSQFELCDFPKKRNRKKREKGKKERRNQEREKVKKRVECTIQTDARTFGHACEGASVASE